jgi:DNA polymerase III epsilon subunit-like protein
MIALDIESSGLDPERNSILSIGALDTDEPTNQFYDECRVWEGAHVSDEALAINGFTQEEATDSSRKSEAELIKAFLAWALDRPKDRTIVGQNSSFDRDFAQAACARAGVEFPFAHRTIDTHSLVWLHMVQAGITPPMRNLHTGINLTEALAYCGLPPELKPHNALNGAFAHAEVFARIAYNKKMLPEYVSYEIPWLTN